MENNTMNGLASVTKKENIHISLVKECMRIAGDIGYKIQPFSSGLAENEVDTPSRSELEHELKNLRNYLQSVSSGIVE